MDARRILFVNGLRSGLNFPESDINEGGFVFTFIMKDKNGIMKEYVVTSNIPAVNKTLELMANKLSM